MQLNIENIEIVFPTHYNRGTNRGELMSGYEKSRLNFRVNIKVPVEITINEMDTVYRGFTFDLSGGGISFFLDRPISLHKSDILHCVFILNKHPFHLKAKLVRSTEESGKYLYAAKFSGISTFTQSDLVTILLKIDFEERFKKHKK